MLQPQPLPDLVGFLEKEGPALHALARQLAGPRGAALVTRTSLAAKRGAPLPRLLADLCDLHAILSLEEVGDPDRPETGFFAALPPLTERFVDEACRLTDAVESHIAELRSVVRAPKPGLAA